ncbi:uncharacterized protein [Dysidea avara]|uniref:uncharacterized protein n=1 Tax=Dysidea avara TaxID=196820 RepID=UPI0033197731
MRVNLAAQVLSKSVADCFEYYDETDTIETQRFVRKFDRFFDMLNTRNLDEAYYKLKPDLRAYRKKDDTRFEWLKVELLGYIEEWKSCVSKKEGFNATQKKMMTLSEETIEGLQITVGSFVEVAPFLLEQPEVKFLYSVRFNQDTVEAYFGLQ